MNEYQNAGKNWKMLENAMHFFNVDIAEDLST